MYLKPLLTVLIFIFCFKTKQESSIDIWIDNIVQDMIEMNDLDKYSNKPIASDVSKNFFLVESVKNIEIKDDSFTMLINHGQGTYCTKLKFKYIQKKGQFYLVFPEPNKTIIFGTKRLFVNPWIEKTNICK